MDGLLLEESRTELAIGDWRECVRELRAELTQLRDEVGVLRRENLELRQQVGYWKGMHAHALKRIARMVKILSRGGKSAANRLQVC